MDIITVPLGGSLKEVNNQFERVIAIPVNFLCNVRKLAHLTLEKQIHSIVSYGILFLQNNVLVERRASKVHKGLVLECNRKYSARAHEFPRDKQAVIFVPFMLHCVLLTTTVGYPWKLWHFDEFGAFEKSLESGQCMLLRNLYFSNMCAYLLKNI